MAIVTIGFCEDCDTTVDIDFDADNGAPMCSICGCYEVADIESYVSDDEEDEDDLELALEELEDDDGEIVDDEF